MEHAEFLSTRRVDGHWLVHEITSTPIYKSKINRFLVAAGSSMEAWYESLVPNPGCKFCGSRVEFQKLSSGWRATCSPSCHSNLMAGLVSDRNVESWKSPEYRKSTFLRLMHDAGHTSASSYLALVGDRLKFGVSTDPESRVRRLGGTILTTTGVLPIEEAAEVEYLVATKFFAYILDNEYLPLYMEDDVRSFLQDLKLDT